MIKTAIKIFILILFYFIACLNVGAESYRSDSGNIEVIKNENTLDFIFSRTILLGIYYNSPKNVIITNNIIRISPTFEDGFMTRSRGFRGACNDLCNDLMSITGIVVYARCISSNQIELRLNRSIQSLQWRGRRANEELKLNFSISQPIAETSQKILRISKNRIPSRMDTLFLLNNIKNTNINFTSDVSVSSDRFFDLISFTLNDVDITSEKLFKHPFDKFINISNDANIYTMIPKNLQVDTSVPDVLSLDFYNSDKETIRGLPPINVNREVTFIDYIETLIQIVNNNLPESHYFLAKRRGHIFEFLRDDQTTTTERLISITLVEHKEIIQFSNERLKNTFINDCNNIEYSEDSSSNLKLLLNDRNALSVISGEDSLRKIVCSPNITYFFSKIAGSDTYSYDRRAIIRTFQTLQDTLINCPDFIDLTIGEDYHTENSDPSGELRELIDSNLRNFIRINIDPTHLKITFLPKEFVIAHSNSSEYMHLFTSDDEIIDNKIRCTTFQKLNNQKVNLLENWKKYLIRDYSIEATPDNETIRITFSKGYAKFVLDRVYRNNSLFIKDFNNDFNRLTSPNNKIMDNSSIRASFGAKKPDYANYISGPIQAEISIPQELTKYSFNPQDDTHTPFLYTYIVTPRFDYFKIKFKFYKKLFREERSLTIYPSRSRVMQIYYSNTPYEISVDPGLRNTYLSNSSKKILHNQPDHLEQFFNNYKLPASLSRQYSIVYFNSIINNPQKTILGEFYLKDNMNKILIVYYPLQYTTSYRGTFPVDDRKDKYINSIDRKFRHFLAKLLEDNIYNKIFVRYANSLLLEANANYERTIQHLFHEKRHYEHQNYNWNNNLLIDDYRLDIQNTSSVVDIIYLGAIRTKRNILGKFKNFSGINKLYFLNIVSPQIFRHIGNIPAQINQTHPFIKVININFNNFEDTNYDIFSSRLFN